MPFGGCGGALRSSSMTSSVAIDKSVQKKGVKPFRGKISDYSAFIKHSFNEYVEGAARQRRFGDIYFFGMARRIRLPNQSEFAMPARYACSDSTEELTRKLL
jgi:hypothetical protein